MSEVTVKKMNDGVSWGALYWQYFEQLDKITSHETPLKLNKKLFLQKNSQSGQVIVPIENGTMLKIGDKIRVRIELRVDRDIDRVVIDRAGVVKVLGDRGGVARRAHMGVVGR